MTYMHTWYNRAEFRTCRHWQSARVAGNCVPSEYNEHRRRNGGCKQVEPLRRRDGNFESKWKLQLTYAMTKLKSCPAVVYQLVSRGYNHVIN